MLTYELTSFKNINLTDPKHLKGSVYIEYISDNHKHKK